MEQWAHALGIANTALGTAAAGATVLKDTNALFNQARELLAPGSQKLPRDEVIGLLSQMAEKLLKAQLAQAEVLNVLNELERTIVAAKQIEDERQRYELVMTPGDSIVLALKPGDPKGEPPHFLCPSCFEDGKKRILQPLGRAIARSECHGCGKEFRMDPPEGGGDRITSGYRGP